MQAYVEGQEREHRLLTDPQFLEEVVHFEE
jgi:hypothetical protein